MYIYTFSHIHTYFKFVEEFKDLIEHFSLLSSDLNPKTDTRNYKHILLFYHAYVNICSYKFYICMLLSKLGQKKAIINLQPNWHQKKKN